MATLVIEHLKVSQLPEQWAQRLKIHPDQTVTVRIETEADEGADEGATTFVTDDPAFGIWRDRDDVTDVESYLRALREPRYKRDGSRNRR